jgi:hypothetical protein
LKPGEVFERGGFYWRVRQVGEPIDEHDYRISEDMRPGAFCPNIRVYEQPQLSKNDQANYHYVHPISWFSYIVGKAAERHHETR